MINYEKFETRKKLIYTCFFIIFNVPLKNLLAIIIPSKYRFSCNIGFTSAILFLIPLKF